jgi:hypothetical protein
MCFFHEQLYLFKSQLKPENENAIYSLRAITNRGGFVQHFLNNYNKKIEYSQFSSQNYLFIKRFKKVLATFFPGLAQQTG